MRAIIMVLLTAVAVTASVEQTAHAQTFFSGPEEASGVIPVSHGAITRLPPSDGSYETSFCGGHDCCAEAECCLGWCHRINVFGEYMYLRPRNAEVAYAVAINGALLPGAQVQTGPVQLVDPDYSSGFRGGIGFSLSECDAIVLTYSQFDAETHDNISLPGTGDVLRSLVSHPNAPNVGGDGLDANASQSIQFKLIDLDYKGLLSRSEYHEASFIVGARYAQLDQRFDANFAVNGFERVNTEINFEGAGLRAGLEGMHAAGRRGAFVYGKGSGNLIGGEFRSTYRYENQADALVTDTSWEAGRLVTIVDLEAGFGWRNKSDTLRLSGGYMFSCWYDTLRTNEWINAVQENNFVDPSDNFNGTMSFDGFVARLEYLW